MASALIIDQSASRRARIREIAHTLGMDAWEANTGHEALELARMRSFELMIVNMHPPDMDGLALLRRIKDGRAPGPMMLLLCNFASLDSLRPLVDHQGTVIVHREAPTAFLRGKLQALLRTAPARNQPA